MSRSSIRTMVLERASAGDIRRQAVAGAMKCLRDDGWRLVRAGRTTPAEVLRVTKDERFNGDARRGGSSQPRQAPAPG